MLESRVLSGDLPQVNEFSDAVTTVTLNENNPITTWNVYIQKNRTLILPTFFAASYPVEHKLVLRNDMTTELVVAIDELEGLPLRGNASLSVPASSAIMYTLIFYPRGGDVKWSLADSYVL
jgi:hypothetical protein